MIEERPWGTYESVFIGDRMLVKVIAVLPGKRLSLQVHKNRDEHWYFVEGRAKVTKGEWEHTLFAGDSIEIPRDWPHRIDNTYCYPCILVEIQTGICNEDDIIRLEDDYGRAE